MFHRSNMIMYARRHTRFWQRRRGFRDWTDSEHQKHGTWSCRSSTGRAFPDLNGPDIIVIGAGERARKHAISADDMCAAGEQQLPQTFLTVSRSTEQTHE